MSPTVPPTSTIATSASWRASPRALLDEALDLVGDVRDHLHRARRGTRRGAPS
jgi:hypothetical protein